jgi:hypothetical protein
MSKRHLISVLTNLRQAITDDESFTSGKVLLSSSETSKGRHGISFIANRD